MKSVPLLSLLAITAGLAACAVQQKTEPVTDFGQLSCKDEINLATATSLVLDAEEPQRVSIWSAASCTVDGEGMPYVFTLFALPPTESAYTVTIQSSRIGEAQFAPRALLLDQSGGTLQELPLARFTQRGPVLQGTLFVAAKAQERYLLVRSEPGRVGEVRAENLQSANSTPIVASGLMFNYASGSETRLRTTLSLNGELNLRVKRQIPLGTASP